jgi:outer membrane protein assembly factor BamB
MSARAAHPTSVRFLPAAACLLCLACGPRAGWQHRAGPGTSGALPSGPASAVPLPFGVASPDGDVGYVAGHAGGIDAIDLRSGKLLWSSQEAFLPLLAVEGAVLTAATVPDEDSAVAILGLARAGGAIVFESYPLEFPPWVRLEASVPCCGGGWSAGGARLMGGVLELVWSASWTCVGGTGVVTDESAYGLIRVDLETGSAELEEADAPPLVLTDVPEASPVILSGRALFTDIRDDDTRLLVAVDATSGKPLWERAIKPLPAIPPCTALSGTGSMSLSH